MQDSADTDDLQPPALLANRYELGQELGRGGMGVVYQCRDRETDEARAVKFLTGSRVKDEGEIRRFQHEAKVLTRFEHPNIIRVFDFGVEGEFPYLISELCLRRDGRPGSLEELQQQAPSRQLTPAQLTVLIPPVIGALADLHAAGLIHRDIKPSNILLSESPDGRLTPKLSDFGLVAVTGDEAMRQLVEFTMSLSIEQDSAGSMALVGTYAYMSPEQKRGEVLDARSDVYSLGLMVYRLATGYDRVSFVLPSEVDEGVPTWVDEIVKGSVDTDKDQRVRSAEALYERLPENLRGYRSKTSTPAPDSASEPTEPATPQPPATPRVTPSRPTGPPPRLATPVAEADDDGALGPAPGTGRSSSLAIGPTAVAAMALLLILAALGVALFLRTSRPEAPGAPSIQRLLASASPVEVEAGLARLHDSHDEAGRDLLPALKQLLKRDDDRIRRLTAAYLGDLGQHDQRLQELLIECLADGDPEVRSSILRAMVDWQPPPARAAVAVNGVFKSSAEPVRGEAARLLDRLNVPTQPTYLEYFLYQENFAQLAMLEEAALPYLRSTLQGPSAPMRLRATDALAYLGKHGKLTLTALGLMLEDDDANVRSAAANALASIGEPALPVLMPLLRSKSPTTQSTARRLIGACRPEPSVATAEYLLYTGRTQDLARLGMPALRKLMPNAAGYGEEEVKTLMELAGRQGKAAAELVPQMINLLRTRYKVAGGEAVIEALGQIGPAAEPAAPELAALLRSDLTRAKPALDALLKIRPPAQPDLAPFYLMVAQGSGNVSDQLYALQELAKLKGSSEAELGAYEQLALSTDEPVATAAVTALSRAGVRALPVTRRLLASDRDTVKLRALAVLAALGESAKPATGDLVPLLQESTHPQVRQAAIVALAGVGKPAIDGLLGLLKLRAYRDGAAEALGRIGEPALIRLRNALLDRDRDVRLGALKAIAAMGPKASSAEQDLLTALDDRNRFFPEEVLDAIGAIGATGNATRTRVLAMVNSPERQVSRAALTALSRMGKEGVTSLGFAMMHQRNLQVREDALDLLLALHGEAAPALPHLKGYYMVATDGNRKAEVLKLVGEMGAEAADSVSWLQEALASKDLNLKVAAAEALGNLGAVAAKAVPALEEAKRNEKSPWFGAAATTAIKRIRESRSGGGQQ